MIVRFATTNRSLDVVKKPASSRWVPYAQPRLAPAARSPHPITAMIDPRTSKMTRGGFIEKFLLRSSELAAADVGSPR